MTTGVLNHKITRRGFLKTSAALGAVAALGDRLFGGPLSTLMVGAQVEGVVSDKWVASTCAMCRGGRDLVRGHVVNGVLVKVEGNAEHQDKIPSPSLCCIKPQANVQWVYNPWRVKSPMKRTNPNKGINEDPGFVEISWDEALTTLADKLTEIRDSAQGLKNELGKNRVAQSGTIMGKSYPGTMPGWGPFFSTFGPTDGGPSIWPNVCYGTEHYYSINWHYLYSQTADTEYANWMLAIGKNKIAGTTMGHGVSGIKDLADFRVRAAKMIYLGPYQGQTGAKADEWIAIKPATDGAFLYAMINVIIHELDWRQVGDIDFIKKVTASPYLVTPNGYWARDPATKKPLVWDSVAGAAKVHDDPTIGDFALDGGPYTINAVERAEPDRENGAETPVTQGTPSFQLTIDHFKSFTPEWAAAITDVPAKTIRRIAHEFVENSMVGSTIEIDGYTYRYRPATMQLGKHCTSGIGSYSNVWGVGVLYMLMGSFHAPGGMTVPGIVHSSEEWNWTTDELIDGFEPWHGSVYYGQYSKDNSYGGKFSWPPEGRTPSGLSLLGSPAAMGHRALFGEAVHDLPGSVPDVIVALGNKVANSGDANQTRSGLEKVSFFAHIAMTVNETNWYADLLLPDTLQTTENWIAMSATADPASNILFNKYNFYSVQQPMIKPPVDAREVIDIMTDLAEKMGPEFLAAYNQNNGIMGADADPTRKYTAEEVMDRMVRNHSSIPAEMRGQYGLDYYKEHGALFFPVSKTQLNFYRVVQRTGTRYEIPYQEGWKRSSEKRLEELHGVGINWRDAELGLITNALLPYEDTRAVHDEVYEAGGEYDLWQLHHRTHQYGFGRNLDVPWHIESADPDSDTIVLNPETAAKKGLKDGDWVALETRLGGKTTGRLNVSPTIRPDVVEIASHGHYRVPISRLKGTPSSPELESGDARLVAACGDIRCSGAIVKISKAEKIIPNVPV